MYRDKTLKQYLDDLAAKVPAPGGGSAAALTAGLGASLISMVVNFTLGKPQYARFEEELKEILFKSEDLRSKFLDLVDLDVSAYKSKNIKAALDIPFKVCRLCVEAIKLCPPLIKKGNIRLISDVSVAACLLESAFASACYNVEINLGTLNDKSLTTPMRKELTKMARWVNKIRQDTEVKVGKIIRG
ncbi:MAG: cyclodeaminase/cyclohydrolase family protein [Candidatus Omnitrophota bacterium]